MGISPETPPGCYRKAAHVTRRPRRDAKRRRHGFSAKSEVATPTEAMTESPELKLILRGYRGWGIGRRERTQREVSQMARLT
jgi:hypothetical protein